MRDPSFSFGTGDLVHHELAWCVKTVSFVRFNEDAEEGCLGGVGGKGADCDGPCGIETVILNDYGRPRFARILWATGDRPDLASSGLDF